MLAQGLSQSWRSLGESNPCFRRERATSWTARRREQREAKGRFYIGGAARWQGRKRQVGAKGGGVGAAALPERSASSEAARIAGDP